MIKVHKSIPEAYYENSRDFQLLGRVNEVLYNYLLMNSNLVNNNNVSNDTLLDMINLILYSLGFYGEHDYPNTNLLILASVFKTIMKIKGTKAAIEYCIDILFKSQNIKSEYNLKIGTLIKSFRTSELDDNGNEYQYLELYLPSDVKDTVLIEDLFEYILPAGFIYNIYYVNTITTNVEQDIYDFNAVAYKTHKKNSSSLFGQVFKPNSDNKTHTTVIVNSGSIPPNDDEISSNN